VLFLYKKINNRRENYMTTLEKRQKRAALVTQAREILNKAETEKRTLSGEETTKYEAMMADVDSLKNEIDREDRQAVLEQEMRESTGHTGAGNESGQEQRDTNGKELRIIQKPEYRSAFNKLISLGINALNSEERALIKSEEQRALAVGTGTAGGYTVPQGFYDQLTEAMKFFGGIRKSKASILRTSTGNALPMPTVNDTGNMGELVAENSAVSAQDIVFGQTILNAYKFSSKTVLVSIELLQDSAFDLETFLARKLGERLGRVQNNYFTIGTGVSQPQGIVTAATLGKTGLVGQTTSIIYDDLVDLEHSIDPAYRADAQYMMHDSSLKALKKLKDGYQRPLWLPGITEKAPDTILGYEYVINNDMAVMAANAKSMIFGDLSNFFVRDVMDVTLFRIAEKYIESGQVGFLAFYRGDSKLLDAGMHPVSYYANSAT
jgi:HK97 family phage major capsid protein